MKSTVQRAISMTFLLIVFTISDIPAQDTLSLSECLSEVHNASPEIRKIALEDQILGIRTKLNTLSFYPQTSLNGKATWQTDVTTIPLQLPGTDIPSPDQDQYAITLELTQSIYDGGRTRLRREVINQEYVVATRTALSGLHTAEETATMLFFRVALYDQLISSSDLHISQLAKTIRVLESRVANGVAEKKDVLEGNIRMSQLEQRKEEATRNKEAARMALAILMGRSDKAFEVLLDDDVEPLPTVDVDFQNHAAMQMLNARFRLLQSQEEQNRAQYRPSIGAFANLAYGKPGLNFLGQDFDTYATVGATVTVPISHLYTGKVSRENEIFRLQQEKLDQEKALLKQNLATKADQHLQEIAKLSAWLNEDREIMRMRENVRDILHVQLEEGIIPALDYLNALDELSLSEEQIITHQVMLQQEYALLRHLHTSPTIHN